MNEYHIVEHMSYDWMVVTYFFLGGASAGSYILSVIANYWNQEFKPLAKTGAIIAPIVLAAGILFILLDLGIITRFWRLYATFVPTSVLSWGAWFLNVFFIITIIYAFLLIQDKSEDAKKIAYLGFPLAIGVGSYTGAILLQMPGRALWHSPIIPAMFLLGGVISGSALVMLLSLGSGNRDLLEKLGKIIAWLLVVEVGLVFLEMFTLFNGGADEVHMAKYLLFGDYSRLFLVVEVLGGAILPMFILFRKQPSPALQAVASILILIGIYTMRYVVIIGGQVPTF